RGQAGTRRAEAGLGGVGIEEGRRRHSRRARPAHSTRSASSAHATGRLHRTPVAVQAGDACGARPDCRSRSWLLLARRSASLKMVCARSAPRHVRSRLGRLADFDQLAVWVAQVTADLTVPVLGRGEELRAPRAPGMVDRVDVGHAHVEGHADGLWVSWGRHGHHWLVAGWASAHVQDNDTAAEPEDRGIPVADNLGAHHVVVEIAGAILVGNDHEHRQGHVAATGRVGRAHSITPLQWMAGLGGRAQAAEAAGVSRAPVSHTNSPIPSSRSASRSYRGYAGPAVARPTMLGPATVWSVPW